MKMKAVMKIDPVTNKIIGSYTSIAQAAALSYISATAICMCAKGKIKTAGGYKWKYTNDVNVLLSHKN